MTTTKLSPEQNEDLAIALTDIAAKLAAIQKMASLIVAGAEDAELHALSIESTAALAGISIDGLTERITGEKGFRSPEDWVKAA